MKTVELKKVEFEIQGQKEIFDYKIALQMLVESPEDPERGVNVQELRKSLRVLDVLENSEDTAEFEDADFVYLQHRVKNMRFTSANHVFDDFVSYFENL